MVKNPPPSAGLDPALLCLLSLVLSGFDTVSGLDPWVGKIPWRKAWQPTQVFFLGNPVNFLRNPENSLQKSLAGYSP